MSTRTPDPPPQPGASARAAALDEGPPGGGSGRHGTFASLRYRDYRLLWFGQASHAAALWMEQIARPWLVLNITNESAAHVGGVVAMRTLPQMFFGVWAGVLADQFDRKTILLATKVGVLTLNVVFVTLLVTGLMELWMIYVASFIRGSFMAFDQPARQSMIASIVPREILTNAVALMSSTQNVMRMVGVLASGAVIATLGIEGAFIAVTVVYTGAVVSTALLRVPTNRIAGSTMSFGGMTESLKEGLRYAIGVPVIRSVLLMSLLFFVFGQSYLQVFAPLFARTTLDIGAIGFSLLIATSTIGALTGTMFIASRYPKRLGLILPVSVTLMGVALVVFSLTTYLPGALGLVVPFLVIPFVGAMQTVYFSLSNAAMLAAAPEHMRGRVVSLLSLDRAFVSAGASLGGLLAAAQGVQVAQIVYGATLAILGLVVLMTAKNLRAYVAD
ncbi:MAG: MFS transporter [Dehalococcoidia bacterium]